MTLNLESTILKHFDELEDPRIERTKQHQLIDIVALAILAVLAGADGWTAIETYGQGKVEWLSQFLGLPNGIPSHDTIARVFSRLDPQAFEQCFLNWIASITQALGAQVIPIDGKQLRQSFDRNQGQQAIQVVSAWASQHRIVLGQVKVEAKSNEITAIPKLLEMLSIRGCIITIDASRIRKNHAPENFALLRHLALNLLNRDKSVKGSLRQKRYRAGLDNNYLVKVITSI
ncbi:MAG: ISAs1 family transposase [Symplocastrum torsivum CPER-KK1]|jgi:predicted transposase YbfD/YdcC|uniref:ISAs1 family transposase n=1 Tax=Symplocastrum torsivum CPER-KK1 TaxID=450513 RepID=A0A951PSN5_9CYAN|nr:ISAs1 family transposase [Symplocastrum torsivum CPER-KK1]